MVAVCRQLRRALTELRLLVLEHRRHLRGRDNLRPGQPWYTFHRQEELGHIATCVSCNHSRTALFGVAFGRCHSGRLVISLEGTFDPLAEMDRWASCQAHSERRGWYETEDGTGRQRIKCSARVESGSRTPGPAWNDQIRWWPQTGTNDA